MAGLNEFPYLSDPVDGKHQEEDYSPDKDKNPSLGGDVFPLDDRIKQAENHYGAEKNDP